MPDIHIEVRNKIAKQTDSTVYVCNNSDFVVVFDFDQEWSGLATKIARFVKRDRSYKEVIFSGSSCHVPVIEDQDYLYVGVYSGNISTTTPAKIVCKRSILSISDEKNNGLSAYLDFVDERVTKFGEDIGDLDELVTEGRSSLVAAINETYKKADKPYASIRRLATYLYELSFETIQEHKEGDPTAPSGCSSFLQNGRLYRHFDWNYDETPSFFVQCPGFRGMAYTPGVADGTLSDDILGQLPYRLVDGVNDYGIRVSAHVLYNDWGWHGTGNTPLYLIPYYILTELDSLDSISEKLSSILSDLHATPTLTQNEYLLHFFVTDGENAYCIMPPESDSGDYVVVDISENPKLSNFRWVNKQHVERTELQLRPTGVERWNLMPCSLEDIRFTKAYESPNRLSEFIGLRGTTKDSSDEELEELYEIAHERYLSRERNGSTWQTVHSIVYSGDGIYELYVQEDWNRNYVSGGKTPVNWEDVYNKPFIPTELGDLSDDPEHRTVTDDEKNTWGMKQDALEADVDYATPEKVENDISQATADMATMTWVGGELEEKQDNISDLDDIRTGASLGATAYQKPLGGIPKNDLDSNVKESLSKADSSIQSLAGYATEAFVNSSIENVAAYFITKNASGEPFATKAELNTATVFYSGGAVRVPTRNDYTVVLADESKADAETGEAPTTRYLYYNGWQYQYVVNNNGLTAAQWAAVNSGATAAKAALWDAKQDALTPDVDYATPNYVDDAIEAAEDSLVVTVTGSTSDTSSVDIYAAHEAGKDVLALYSGRVYRLVSATSSNAMFTTSWTDSDYNIYAGALSITGSFAFGASADMVSFAKLAQMDLPNKDYVDDAIASAIGDAIGGSY